MGPDLGMFEDDMGASVIQLRVYSQRFRNLRTIKVVKITPAITAPAHPIKVRMVTSTPRTNVPRRIAIKARHKGIPKSQARTTAVVLPLPGTGIATRMTIPISWYRWIIPPSRLERLTIQSPSLATGLILLDNLYRRGRAKSKRNTVSALPANAVTKAIGQGIPKTNIATGIAPRIRMPGVAPIRMTSKRFTQLYPSIFFFSKQLDGEVSGREVQRSLERKGHTLCVDQDGGADTGEGGKIMKAIYETRH